jgi:ribosome assembly protein RRB1
MGKASKRRSNQGTGDSCNKTSQAPAVKVQEEETLENLRFEDPYEDEFEEEVIVQAGSDNELVDEDRKIESEESDKNAEAVKAWTPAQGLEPGQNLEMDELAYTMHHGVTPEWPALSFDFIRDDYGEGRTRFPHTVLAVVGTQASKREWNKVQILKMSDLGRTSVSPSGGKKKKRGEEENESSDEEMDEDEDDDSDDDEMKHNPVLEHITLHHNGGVNRIRSMPTGSTDTGADGVSSFLQSKRIVSAWSDEGHVSLYDIAPCLDQLDRSAGSFNSDLGADPSQMTYSKKPFFTYRGHSTEGYAMDWSRVRTGCLATGDCRGQIHIWNPTESAYEISCAYDNAKYGANGQPESVEDIQWSPTEATVLAAGECNGAIQIYDTRRAGKPMITHKAHPNIDVNVLSWNAQVTNLLASGGDDGTFSVWDLRTFGGENPAPLARFTYSQKPITSVEWHPTDESMIMVTDEDASYVYDLSIEADAETEQRMTLGGEEVEVPPQLLFLHCGSRSTKEAHWHPQIPSLVMTTALSGFNLFIPSNL